MTRVRNLPGVARGPLRMIRREKTRPIWSGRPIPRLSWMTVEEDPPGDRLVQHLGEGELCLQHRDVIAVPGGLVGRRVRVRQDGQPLAGQRLDLVLGQRVADRLQPGDVIAGAEPVI